MRRKFDSRVADLHDLVQVGEGLVLVDLRYTQLLYQQLLDLLHLLDLKRIRVSDRTYFVIDGLYFVVPLLLKHLVVLTLLVFDDFLALEFHVEELAFAHVDLVMDLPPSVVLVFFFADALFEQLFFLVHHHSFKAHGALLQLNLAALKFLGMVILKVLVHFLPLLDLLKLLLLSNPLLFQFLMVPVSGPKQLLRLLVRNVS